MRVIRRFIAAAAFAAPLLFGLTPAYAGATPPPPDECSSPGVTCQYDGTQWNVYDNSAPEVSDPNGDPTSHVKSFAITGFVVVFSIGLIVTIWRVRMARRLASDAGIDPDAATAATLLGTGGLTATYLAANMVHRPTAVDEPPVRHVEPPVNNEHRLAELKSLHDQGLITDDDYDKRRAEILDGI